MKRICEKHPESPRNKEGRCCECRRENQRARAPRYKERYAARNRERAKARRAADPEKHRKEELACYYRRAEKIAIRLRMKKYGLTLEQATELLKTGVCGICNKPVKGKGQHIDHCHTTGKVRGVLCARCNVALGAFGDSIQTLERAIDYLRFNGG